MKSEHNSFPYNDTEWNNIVNDAFTSDAQPHVFSERYARRKQQMLHQMEESPMRSHKFHMKKSMTALVAVAAAVVILPTAVYASTQIRGYFQTKDGVYQQEVVIPKSESVSDQDHGITGRLDAGGNGDRSQLRKVQRCKRPRHYHVVL